MAQTTATAHVATPQGDGKARPLRCRRRPLRGVSRLRRRCKKGLDRAFAAKKNRLIGTRFSVMIAIHRTLSAARL